MCIRDSLTTKQDLRNDTLTERECRFKFNSLRYIDIRDEQGTRKTLKHEPELWKTREITI